ncbi:carboxy-terminal processing protease CtpB precursor [bacterium BMS3Abin04]|nr:carboxy-terminal processing protease CtpB precursor [bacterium BMS3Abin04]
MNKKYKFILVVVIILSFGFLLKSSDIYFEISKSIDIFGRIYKEVTLNYVDPVDPEEFMLAGIKGMLSSLDPYTVYIDSDQQKELDLITTGKYGGIGATVGLKNGNVTIVDLIEGYSAQRQGIRIGDVIVKVDSVEISKDNYNQLGSLLKKPAGSEVTVTISREGVKDNILFNLISEEIEIKNLTYYGFVPSNSTNAYLKLSGFSRSAGSEVKKALIDLENKKKVSSIVLDLRGNPGGLLDAAIGIADKFLRKGNLIVSVIGRDTSRIQKYYSKEVPVAGDIKMAVLINGGSASASEILSGAIQDHDRGIIVGTNSFGKGLVQSVVPLSFNTSLKITTAKYYTPSGRCIQKIDYSKSKIFKKNTFGEKKAFHTDHDRIVYSSGGIKPDSVVSAQSESEQIKFLLARGMFFKFASFYFNTHNNLNLNTINQDKLFNEFIDYVDKQNLNYTSNAEKVLAELNKIVIKEDYNSNVKQDLEILNKKFEKIKNQELRKYKTDINTEILQELAARISGRKGRIEQALKNDPQFKAAFEILQNKILYARILINE